MERSDRRPFFDNIIKVHADLKKNLECSICMEVPSQISRTPCGHFFCQDCINKLVKDKRSAKCPICNATINRRTVTLNDEMSECAKRLIKLSEVLEEDFNAAILADYEPAKGRNQSSKTTEASYDHMIDTDKVPANEAKVTEWLNKEPHENHYDCQPSTSSSSPTFSPSRERKKLSLSAKANESESTGIKSTSQKPSPKDESEGLNQSSTTLASIDKKWSVVKKFGKEMRPKRVAKSLNVIVEPAKKPLSTSTDEIDNNNTIVKKRGSAGKKKLANSNQSIATVEKVNLTASKEKPQDPSENTEFNADVDMAEDLPVFSVQADTEQIVEPVPESHVVEKETTLKSSNFSNSRLMSLSKNISPKKTWLAMAQETEMFEEQKLNSSGSSQTHTTTSSTETTTSPQPVQKTVPQPEEPEDVPSDLPSVQEVQKSPLKSATKAPRNRLSLGKTNQLKRLTPNSPIKHDLVPKHSRNAVVQFHKLGRMLKQKKTIPFHYCGKLRYSLGRIDETGMGRQFFSFSSETPEDSPDDNLTNLQNSNTVTSTSTHFSEHKNPPDKLVDENHMHVDENESDEEIPTGQPAAQPVPNERSKSQESIIQVRFLTNSTVATPVLAENRNKQNTQNSNTGSNSDEKLSDGQNKVDSDTENIHAKKRSASQQSDSSASSIKPRTKVRKVLPLKDTPPEDFDNDICKDSNSDKSSRKSDDTDPVTVKRTLKRNSSRKLSSSSGSNASTVVSNSSRKRKRTESPSPVAEMEEIAKATLNNWCKNLNSSNKSRSSGSSPSSVRDSASSVEADVVGENEGDRMDITDNRGYNILDPKIPKAKNGSPAQNKNCIINSTMDNFDKAMGEVDTQVLLGNVPATPLKKAGVQFVSSTPMSNKIANSRQSSKTIPDSLEEDEVPSSLVEDTTGNTVIHVSTKTSLTKESSQKNKASQLSELSMVSQIDDSLVDKPRSVKKMRLSGDKFRTRNSLQERKSAEKKAKDFKEDSFNITQDVLIFKQLEAELLAGNAKKRTDEEEQDNMNMGTPNMNENDDDIVEGTPQTKKKRNVVPSTPPTEPLTPSDISPIPDLTKKHQALITPRVSAAPNSGNLHRFDNAQAGRLLKTRIYHSTPKVSEVKPYSLACKSKSVNPIDTIKEKTSPDRATVDANEQKLCFVCSGLQLAQIDLVKRFADSIGATYQSAFSPQVTHVVVKCREDQSADNTLKYLQGIAYRKWVVSYNWVVDSMKQKKILPEDKYEVVESSSLEPGPRKSRLRSHDIFDKFAFLCLEPYVAISVDDCKNLIIQTGGKIARSVEDLASMTDRHRIIVVQEDTHDENTIDKMASKARAIPVSQDWVTESISQYSLIPLPCYIQVVTIQDAERLDFPKELLEDDDEVLSSFDDRA